MKAKGNEREAAVGAEEGRCHKEEEEDDESERRVVFKLVLVFPSSFVMPCSLAAAAFVGGSGSI